MIGLLTFLTIEEADYPLQVCKTRHIPKFSALVLTDILSKIGLQKMIEEPVNFARHVNAKIVSSGNYP